MTDISIVPITAARLPVLGGVFGRAFKDDPMLRWPISRSLDPETAIRQTFSSIYRGVVGNGVAWEAGDADGFAVWIPPGAAEDLFESDVAVRGELAHLTDDAGERYAVLWSWIEERVPHDAWYLDVIGVEPACQGTGIGSALIHFGLDRAHADGADAFLETAIESNVGYYERFGFRVIDEGEPAEGGPHIWFMRTGS